MSNFCSKCGSQLDDQAAFCTNCGNAVASAEPEISTEPTAASDTVTQEASVAVAAAPTDANHIGETISATLKGMPAAAKQLWSNAQGSGQTLPSAIVFAIGCLLANILTWVLIVAGLLGGLKDSLGILGSEGSKYIDQMFKGVYGTAIWGGCLSCILPLAITMLIPLVGQLIRKEKVNAVSCFITSASVNVLPSALLLVGALLSLLISQVGMFLILAAVIAGIVVNYKLIAQQFKDTDSALANLAIAAIFAVIVAAVAAILWGVITGYIQNSLLANLGSGFDIEDILGLLLG